MIRNARWKCCHCVLLSPPAGLHQRTPEAAPGCPPGLRAGLAALPLLYVTGAPIGTAWGPPALPPAGAVPVVVQTLRDCSCDACSSSRVALGQCQPRGQGGQGRERQCPRCRVCWPRCPCSPAPPPESSGSISSCPWRGKICEGHRELLTSAPLLAASVQVPWERAISPNKVPYYIK